MILLNSAAFSDKNETTMNKLIRTPGLWMNKGSGRYFITVVKHWLKLYREEKLSCVVSVILYLGRPQTILIQLLHETFIPLQKIPVCQQECGSANATSISVTSSDEFLNTFNKTYKSYPNFQGSLLVALMHVFISNINGGINTAFPVKAMNVIIASDSMSRRTFNLVSANLLVTSICIVQRVNSNSCGTAIIHCDMNSIN